MAWPSAVPPGAVTDRYRIIMAGKGKSNTEVTRARLIGARGDLLRLIDAVEEDRRPVELDQARVGRLSRMAALQGQAMAIETERRRKLEVRRIDAALARLDGGEYGACVECGEDIEPKRLDLDPAVPLCMGCASATKAPH